MTGSRVLVAGVDSSTQATKVVVCDAATGEVVRTGRAGHLDATEVDPEVWWNAFQHATAGGLLDDVKAIAIGAQQHGMVVLDERGAVVRPALLWNDTRSADAAHRPGDRARRTRRVDRRGRVRPGGVLHGDQAAVARRARASLAERVAEVVLPHDWLTQRVLGASHVRPGTATTDRGDASGTGYWSPRTGDYRRDVLARAFGREVGVPRVLGPYDLAGTTSDGVLVAAGTGDNMAAGLGARHRAGRRRGLARDERHGVRRARRPLGGPERLRRRIRRRDRALPPAGLHAQRSPGAHRSGDDGRHRPRRAQRPGALGRRPAPTAW